MSSCVRCVLKTLTLPHHQYQRAMPTLAEEGSDSFSVASGFYTGCI